MSIKIMNRVWESSSHEGSTLLVLLALADHASDDGVCYPGIARLARKARVTERHTKRLVTELEGSGEVYADRTGGRRRTNLYFIVLGFNEEEIIQTLIKRFQLQHPEAVKEARKIVEKRDEKGGAQDTLSGKKGDTHDTVSGKKGDIQGTKRVTPTSERVTPMSERVTPMSPEPSLTVIEPSIKNHQSEASSRTPAGSPISPDRSPGEFNASSPFSHFQKGDDYLSVAAQCEATCQAAGGNYADTSEAGGADVLADHLVTVYCQCMGEANPLGQELVACRATINRVLKRKRLSNDGVVAERGLRVLLDPEGEWTFHFGNYALSGGHNRTKLFETHYGKVLARLLAGGDGYSKQHRKKGARRGPHQKRSAKDDSNYRVATPEEAAPIVAAVKAREARLRGESG